ncbi:hypothetical protein OC845_003909 [Tilletia horrida]|nr:hypothetical protein OC845_003909 [Tilletia horrida]
MRAKYILSFTSSALFYAVLFGQQASAQNSSTVSTMSPGTGSGALCDPRRSVLDPLSHRFRSDCGSREWCVPTALNSSQLSTVAPPPAVAAISTAALSSASLPSSTAATQTSALSQTSLRHSTPAAHATSGTAHQGSAFKATSGSRKGASSGSGYDDGSGSDSGSGSYDPEEDDGVTRATGGDGGDSMWKRNGWETLADWQAFRRSLLSDGGPGYNITTVASRVSLPPDLQSLGSNPALPVATSGVCRPKGCRRDEYPFGYKGVPTDQIPPMCGNGTYCPDQENACETLIPIGGACQLNRDDSCAPPALLAAPISSSPSVFSPSTVSNAPSTPTQGSSGTATSSTAPAFDPPLPSGLARRIMDALLSRRGVDPQNSGTGSSGGTQAPATTASAIPMCLQGICQLANAAQGQACIIDHTQYLGYDSDGREVIDTVSRDNCLDRLYCDEQTRVCLPEKAQGAACAADRECLEFNCNSRGLCDLPPEAPNRLPAWAFVLIGLAILCSLLGTVYGLYKVHLAHRANRAEEIDRYFSEQWTYRQSILSMHAAALAATGGIGLGNSASAAASKSSLIVGSPNGSLFMSPLGTKHLRVLSVDRRDSDDSDQTCLSASGLNLPGQQDGQQYHGAPPVAAGTQGMTTGAPEFGAGPPSFLDGRLSKRKPAPAI